MNKIFSTFKGILINMKIISFFVCSILLLTACSKNNSAPSLTSLELLTGRNWQMIHEYTQIVGEPDKVDFITGDYTPCELDDVYRFIPNNALIRSDSSIVCNSTLHGFWDSQWGTDSAFTHLYISLPFNYSYDFTILQLDVQTLQLQTRITDYLQNQVDYTYVFKSIPIK